MKKSLADIRALVAGMIEVAVVPKGLAPYTRHALSTSMMIKRVEEVVAALDAHVLPTNGLPPRLTEGHQHDLMAGATAKVLVKVEGFRDLTIGRYLHELEEWQVDFITARTIVVKEWWPLPELGTGVSTKQEG